jgi:copper chaperone
MCATENNDAVGPQEGEFPSATGHLKIFTVEGMTCEHCKSSVTEEVRGVAGVESIEVDVATGRLAVTGDVAEDDVRAAVVEAGYKVVS